MELIQFMHKLLLHYASFDKAARIRIDVSMSDNPNEAHLEVITHGKIFTFRLEPSDFPISDVAPLYNHVIVEIDNQWGEK